LWGSNGKKDKAGPGGSVCKKGGGQFVHEKRTKASFSDGNSGVRGGKTDEVGKKQKRGRTEDGNSPEKVVTFKTQRRGTIRGGKK